MEKLKYDSLYKFIVSIGIVIIILPFIFLLGILNNNDIVFIKEVEINQLTNTAKEIISLEQKYKHMVLSNPIIFCIITVIFVICGLIIVIYGIVQWKNKVQKYEDKSRELSIKLLDKKIKNLTKEEKQEKIIKDIEISETENKSKNSSNNIEKQQISKYIDIQENVYQIIRKQFKNYRIFEEVRIDKQMYDCIALSTSGHYAYDYIFEIKYFSTIKSIKGKIRSLEELMMKQAVLYYENSERFAKAVLIIIVENFSEKDRLENQKILNEVKQINEKNSDISKIIITNIDGIKEELNKIIQI